MKQVVKINHNYGVFAVYCSTDENPWLYLYRLYCLNGKKKVFIDEYDSLTDATMDCLTYAMTGLPCEQ